MAIPIFFLRCMTYLNPLQFYSFKEVFKFRISIKRLHQHMRMAIHTNKQIFPTWFERQLMDSFLDWRQIAQVGQMKFSLFLLSRHWSISHPPKHLLFCSIDAPRLKRPYVWIPHITVKNFSFKTLSSVLGPKNQWKALKDENNQL